MPIFSFIGHILTDLFGKISNWREIYKQTNSTFYSLNGVVSKITRLGEIILAVTFLYTAVEVHTSASAIITAVYFVLKKCVHRIIVSDEMICFHDLTQ